MEKRTSVLGLVIDVAVGVVAAGVVAPVALAVSPEALHGRVLLFAVCGGCIGAVHLVRALVPRGTEK